MSNQIITELGRQSINNILNYRDMISAENINRSIKTLYYII